MDLEEQIDLAACMAGDARAWDAFVRRAAPLVLAIARRAARSTSSEIEDYVQEVFLRLVREDFRLLRAFDSRKARLITYLAVITRSVVHERTRRRVLPVARDAMPEFIADRSADDAAARREVTESTERLPLEELSDQQRTVLILMHRQGLSVEEVARRLDITAQTVRSAHHKAVSRLRTLLGVSPDGRKSPSGEGDAARR